MKRFIVFANFFNAGEGAGYNANGWNDFEKDFDTIESAAIYIKKNGFGRYTRGFDWWQIVDTEEKRIVLEG